MDDPVRAVNDWLTSVLSERLPTAKGKPDWHYRDLPRMTHALMDEFKLVVGEDNLQWVTYMDYGPNVRGQLLISPEGMNRLDMYAKRSAQ